MPTSTLFFYVPCLSLKDSPIREALYRAADADHFAIVFMTFLQWVNPSDEFTKMSPIVLFARMREDVFKSVLLSLPDADTWVVFNEEVCYIVTCTGFSYVVDLFAVLHSSKIDCNQSEYHA